MIANISRACIKLGLTALVAVFLLSGTSLATKHKPAAQAAPPHRALVNGGTVTGSPSQEEQAAVAAGFAVTVVSQVQWAAMTQGNGSLPTEFGFYDLLIIGDASNSSTTSQAAAVNAAVWAPVVMGTAGGRTLPGNRILMGIDVTVHDSGSYLNTRATIMREGMAFAGNHPGTGRTGLYFDTAGADGGGNILAALGMLSTPGSGTWTNNGSPPCGGSVSLIASHPAFPTLTTASLQGWGCSLHASWPTFSTDWTALAVATDPSLASRPTCGVDPSTGLSACGQAYILITGLGIVVTPAVLTLTPPIATNPVGTTHTVTAHVTTGVAPFSPIVGQVVTFTVTGTNAGAIGTCVLAGCVTNSNGDVSFTYTGAKGVGNDTITAVVNVNGSLQTATAQKQWVVATTPTPTPTSTPIPPPPPPVIPQVFQNPAVGGIFNGPRSNTPTPVVRAVAVAPLAVNPGAVVIQPPRTGDAGLVSQGVRLADVP